MNSFIRWRNIMNVRGNRVTNLPEEAKEVIKYDGHKIEDIFTETAK